MVDKGRAAKPGRGPGQHGLDAYPGSMSTSKSKSTPAEANAVRRRDASGHIDPKYASELLAKSGKSTNSTEDKAFLQGSKGHEELAEDLGESFVASATSGESVTADRGDETSEAERGGPYVITSEQQEFAEGTDASNPKGATREPFPTT